VDASDASFECDGYPFNLLGHAHTFLFCFVCSDVRLFCCSVVFYFNLQLYCSVVLCVCLFKLHAHTHTHTYTHTQRRAPGPVGDHRRSLPQEKQQSGPLWQLLSKFKQGSQRQGVHQDSCTEESKKAQTSGQRLRCM